MYTMLIVDDEVHILEGLLRTLDWKSYGINRIETAGTYEEALSKAIDLKPDIAIFDVCIGPHRGYDIIKRLNALNLKTNYIVMSGYSDFEYACEAVRCGAKEYLLKPIQKDKLQAVIENIIVQDLKGNINKSKVDDDEIDPVLLVRYDSFPPLIIKILMMVQTEYKKNVSLKSIADKFKMNPTYLGQLFLKEVKLKFSEYLMLYRLTASQDKIIHTDDKISYIASSVGYSNLNYFYLHFHDYFGMSPLEMRKQYQSIDQFDKNSLSIKEEA